MPHSSEISVASTAGLVSIVIPCCGMLEYTKLCVPSLLRNTRPPFELIFLDVGSLDGTAEYLAGLQAGLAGQLRIEIVRTETDHGIKDACQKALRQTLGEYLVLLNNDTVVTNGWLNQLIGLASFSMTVGMAGPMSNMAAPPQLVETIAYRTFANNGKSVANPNGVLVDPLAVERFADKLRTEQKGNWLYAERLGGFCLLIKREVLDKIGGALDQWTDLSLFDSDILSAKAKEHGYALAVCRDLYVHHFGTRTFASGPKSSDAPVPLA
jgi:GT2 family glycosyltransferase